MQNNKPEKEKKVLKRKKILLIIAILLIIHLILILSRISTTKEEYTIEKVPYNETVNYTKVTPEVVEECHETEFNWNYKWEGWNPEKDGYISPNFRLYNLENKAGDFKVEFVFFDDSLYPYEKYKGKNYDLVKDQLSWNDASMHSNKLSYGIGPNQDILITIKTKKKDLNGTYWAYADVEAPSYKKCNSTTRYEIITNNMTITKNRTITVKKNATSSVTLWRLLVEFVKRKV